MSDVVIAGRLTLDGAEASTTVKAFKTQLREANQELVGAVSKFGAMSDEAVVAATKVAGLKDTIGDAAILTDAFNPDAKFKAFGQSIQVVAGGFSALTGTLALFGSESEDVEKALLKVQSALAISQGVNSVLEGIDTFKAFGAQLKSLIVIQGALNFVQTGSFKIQQQTTTATLQQTAATKAQGAATAATTTATVGASGAMKALRVALISTGIGAIVVLLGLLIANFDSVKKFVLNLFPGLEKLGKFFTKLTNAVTDFIGVTSEAERALDRLTKSTEQNNYAIDRRIKILSAQGGKEAEIAKLQKERADNEIKQLQARDKVGEGLNKEEMRRLGELKDEKALVDIEEGKRLKKLNEEAKKASDEKNKAAIEAERDANKQLQKLRAENDIAEIANAQEQQAAKIRLEYETGVKEIEAMNIKSSIKIALIKELGRKEEAAYAEVREAEKTRVDGILTELSDSIKKADEDQTKSRDERIKSGMELLVKSLDAEKKNKEELEQQERDHTARVKAENEQRLQSTAGYLGMAADLVGKSTVAGKVFAIAQTTIDTYQGATSAYKSLSGIPVVGPGLGIAAAGLAIASGLKNVREIVKVKVPGGGGSAAAPSISAPAPLAPQARVSSTLLPQDQINQIGNATVRAFVVESDITNKQEQIRTTSRAARLGG